MKDKVDEMIVEVEQKMAEQIFLIKRQPKLEKEEDGVELNDGYTYEVNSPIPELADAIAKFAIELPNQGLGKGSDKYFVQLITEYFNRLSSTDVK